MCQSIPATSTTPVYSVLFVQPTLDSSEVLIEAVASCGCVLRASMVFSPRREPTGPRLMVTDKHKTSMCAQHAKRTSARQRSSIRSSLPSIEKAVSEWITLGPTANDAQSHWPNGLGLSDIRGLSR